ncbi:hypothetical protein PQ295_001754 [Campylobacter fetus]|uniref:hypothetical protein n=1 Tax=Campylobacter fetus TaxID=196 RepID=UPI00168D1B69|nr:hypothetical protein [Campylobacter fetus]EEO2697392.1 hypothetical protein [Campylobacter fetus]EJB7570196.1 hypothetical protein [Campylobacter fetus]EKL2796807.1 hypothetical protein [Campylobacter fetus]EKO4700129.1 hypothetical protein [Campylobacter fetus]EKQ2139222.1 hypothetical protein [Campylobacter fetus]
MNRPYIMRRARRGFSVYIKGKTYELPKEFINISRSRKIRLLLAKKLSTIY